MQSAFRISQLIAAGTLAAVLSSPATAAIVTLNGDGFDVQYDDTLLGRYGAPQLTADRQTIVFSPTNFIAESVDKQGTRTANSTINLTLLPNAGKSIGLLQLVERGDYLLEYSGTGRQPSVSVSGQIRALNLSYGGQEITDAIDITSGPFSTMNVNADWEGQASVDPTLYPDKFGVSSILRLTLENRLTARSFNLGDHALVEKKTGLVSIDVTVVPLPGALAMLLSALLGLGGLAISPRYASGAG